MKFNFEYGKSKSQTLYPPPSFKKGVFYCKYYYLDVYEYY